MSDLRCLKCSAWLGEAGEPLEAVGVFKDAKDRNLVEGSRYSWRCKGCGWTNVFKLVPTATWRRLEVKTG